MDFINISRNVYNQTVYSNLRVIKFGWRYFPVETSSCARLSLTFRDSKSIIFSSNEAAFQFKFQKKIVHQLKFALNFKAHYLLFSPSSVWLAQFLFKLWSFECESDDELKLAVMSSWNQFKQLYLYFPSWTTNWPLPFDWYH